MAQFQNRRDKDVERALRCQRAENVFCGSPCGIMDQFVSSCGVAGRALLIDCRSQNYEVATFRGTDTDTAGTGDGDGDPDPGPDADPDVPTVVVTNSNVTHSIAGGEYPKRVAQCREATAVLSRMYPEVRTLRDATPDQVDKAKDSMDEITYRRARHVTTENERTVQAKAALDRSDFDEVGRLMSESHVSMRDDYDVSTDEIDALVELAQNFPGVYGSRLTGGGFGGCTVTLVRKDMAGALMEHLEEEYRSKFVGKRCTCFVTGPAEGAREIIL